MLKIYSNKGFKHNPPINVDYIKDATTTTTYPTAAELLGIVARGAASVYGATLGLANPFARNMIVNTSVSSSQ